MQTLTMQTLTDSELDAVSGGQVTATAILDLTLAAAGAVDATVTGEGVTVVAAAVGGLAPEAGAAIAGILTAAATS